MQLEWQFSRKSAKDITKTNSIKLSITIKYVSLMCFDICASIVSTMTQQGFNKDLSIVRFKYRNVSHKISCEMHIALAARRIEACIHFWLTPVAANLHVSQTFTNVGSKYSQYYAILFTWD